MTRALNRGIEDLHLPRRAEGDHGRFFDDTDTEPQIGVLQARIDDLERQLRALAPCVACGAAEPAPNPPVDEATLCLDCQTTLQNRPTRHEH